MRGFVVLLMGIVLLKGVWASESFVYSPTARVLSVRGNVYVIQDGKKIKLVPQANLREGDTIVTRSDGDCTLQLAGNQTIEIGGDKEVTLWSMFRPRTISTSRRHGKRVKTVSYVAYFFWKLHHQGIDFEDETSNTLACARG